MKTKITALFLVSAILFSFAACGKTAADATTTATTVQTTIQETIAATTTELETAQPQTDARTGVETTAATTTAALSAEDENRKVLLPTAISFVGPLKTSLSGVEYPYYKGLGTAGKTAGYIFTTTAKGYVSDIVTLVGIDTKGVITGVEISVINDTKGIGTNVKDITFLNQFIGKSKKIALSKNSADENEVQAITGATISSSGVTTAVNFALDLYKTII